MLEHELRARIRELLRSGELPRVLPAAQQVPPGSPFRTAQIQVGRVSGAACLACGDADPQITYTYPDGRVVRLHPACDAVWQQERERAQ